MGRTIRIIHVQRPEPAFPAGESSPEQLEEAPQGVSTASSPSAA